MSDEQPEIVKGWKLIGFGDDAVAEGQDGCWCYLDVLGDGVFVAHEYGGTVEIPKDVLTRFVERLNGIDPNAEDDRKLGAAVREALNRSARAFTSHAKYLEAVANELDFDNRPIAANLLRAIASASRNEADK